MTPFDERAFTHPAGSGSGSQANQPPVPQQPRCAPVRRLLPRLPGALPNRGGAHPDSGSPGSGTQTHSIDGTTCRRAGPGEGARRAIPQLAKTEKQAKGPYGTTTAPPGDRALHVAVPAAPPVRDPARPTAAARWGNARTCLLPPTVSALMQRRRWGPPVGPQERSPVSGDRWVPCCGYESA